MLIKAIWILFCPVLMLSQEVPNTINIRSSSTIFVEANIVKFNIHLRCEDSIPKNAFNEHKKLEKKILEVIDKYKIPDTTITYSLLNMRKVNTRDKGQLFSTRQDIIVPLSDIKDYTKFQIDLLDNGFDQFDATFSTDKLEGVKEKGYKEALEIAKNDATAIAKIMKKKLGDILEIKTSTRETPYIDANRSGQALMVSYSDKDMTEIKQSVQVHTNIEVTFRIVDK